jgi:serine/threonine protein kinase/tetratricopeptide (TPR) repeat protein
MNRVDHDRVTELFLAARKLPRSDRGAFLEQQCGSDDALRREIEALLTHDDADDGFLEKPAIETAAVASRSIPERIGAYRVIRLLGEGGMGVVYLAEQRHPFRRVALKVMLSAWASPRMLKRFEHEAQVLARLQHPGIAQIFEAAIAESPAGSQPYFAMEYVEGRPITEFARSGALSLRERLGLMIRVCEAVQHAHQKGVIHRDLKPANILVVENRPTDGVDVAGTEPAPSTAPATAGSGLLALPKILDFGIARITGVDGHQATLLTQAGELVGTLPYMSPEQVGGDSTQVDTRSDVYALGLILYELLAERPAHVFDRVGLTDAARVIQETEPAPLSSVDRSFRGDIENIVAKAIHKDRHRRYQSAGEMAADLQRYLDDQPIVARSTSRIYQLRKFARRNRGLVVAACIAIVALTAGAIVSSWQAVRAHREARRAEKVNEFLSRMFVAIDPHAHGREISVLEVVKRAEQDIEPTFGTEPLLEADIRDEIAAIYMRLGALAEAEAHYVAALDIRGRELAPTHPDAIASAANLGTLRSKQGRFSEAEPLLRSAYDGRRTTLGPDHPDTLVTMNDLATTLLGLGKAAEAEPLCRAAVTAQTRLHGEAHLNTLTSTSNLANILSAVGKSDGAEVLFQRAAAGIETQLGPSHPTTLLNVANLARLLKEQNRYDEAEPLQRRVVDGFAERLGRQHPDSVIARANLAMMLWRQDKLDEAESMYRAARDDFAAIFGEDHRQVMTLTTQLALVLEKRSKNDEAAELLRTALESHRRLLGDDHPRTKQVGEHLERVRKKLASGGGR